MSKFNAGDRVYHHKLGNGTVLGDGLLTDAAFVEFISHKYHALDSNLLLVEPAPYHREEFVVVSSSDVDTNIKSAIETAKKLAALHPGVQYSVYKRVTGFSSSVVEVP